MATIKTALKLYDGMTPALKSINNVLGIVINSFESMQTASKEPIDISSIQEARSELAQAAASVNMIEERLESAGNKQDQYTRKTKKSVDMMSRLKGTIMSIGGAMALKKSIDLSDTITQNTARLKFMNDGLQTTEELQRKIYESALRSRGQYNAMTATISKLGILAGHAFSNNDEAIAFTELMNKQFAIGGASIQEQTSAMYQLTQAMASGRLQGDEYRSILENAPLLAQSLARELGVGLGELKEMSGQGLITANVIKNAMFGAAEETNARFAEMPWTWAQTWTTVLNYLQEKLTPFFELLGRGASWIGENWSTLEPIILGIASALGVAAAALLIYKGYTAVMTVVQWALNGAMMANPIILIVGLIAILVGAIVTWVQSVGGLKIAWLIAMNAIKTAWDTTVIALMKAGVAVITFLLRLRLGWLKVKNAIVGFVLDMGVKVLMGFQDMINGAINLLNNFFSMLNKIPGVEIGAIQEVTFATQKAAEVEARKQAMAAEVSDYETAIEAAVKSANEEIALRQSQANINREDRLQEISTLQAEKAAENTGNDSIFDNLTISPLEDIKSNTGGIADHTEELVNSMDTSSEELKYLRELAEQEAINRFTTAEIHIETHNTNNIGSEMDIDGIVEQIEEKLEEAMQSAAEGEAA
ncbi:MAG: tape measure protein [Clostridiales bacterium]|nr:tape measure protein [Clostridiales bacterium]